MLNTVSHFLSHFTVRRRLFVGDELQSSYKSTTAQLQLNMAYRNINAI